MRLTFVEFENISKNVENGAVLIYNHRFRSKINRHKFRNWLQKNTDEDFNPPSAITCGATGVFLNRGSADDAAEDIVLRERSDLPENDVDFTLEAIKVSESI